MAIKSGPFDENARRLIGDAMGGNMWICKNCGPNVTCTCGLGLVPIPYKPPSPELMKLLEQTQQLASDAVMYGSAFWTVGPDGLKRRVNPSTVRVVDDPGCTATPGQSRQWLLDNMPERLKAVDDDAFSSQPHYLRLPKIRQEGDDMSPHIQTMISDYAKAWEDDIMTAGNADQVGGLKDLLSRTHETDKPGVTAMDETDFDTGPLRGRFKAHPDMRGAYGSADASNPLTTVTNMGTGVIRMTDADVFADGTALTAAGVDPALDIGTGNTHLGLATSFGKVPVTPEMKWVGFQAGLALQPRAPLQGETVEAIYRAMHAAAPVPLSPDAKGLVGTLEETAERWYDVADLIESPEGYRNGGFPRESAWRCLNAIELYKNLPVPLVSEAEDRVAALERELDEALDKVVEMQQSLITRNFELIDRNKAHLATLADSATLRALAQKTADQECAYLREITDLKRRLALPTDPGDHPYHGPTETVPHPDYPKSEGRTAQHPVPDPAHEQFHRAVGDVLAGKIIPAARRQMEDALGRAPKEAPTFPDKALKSVELEKGVRVP